MKQFVKNILVLAVTSALSLAAISHSHGATYEVVEVDKNAEAYTYGGKLNIKEQITVSDSNSYNFPVQFDYFDDNDFNSIVSLALTRHNYIYGLEVIEDLDAMKAGEPTANDLAWAKLYLQVKEPEQYFKYQIVADIAGMINLDAADESIASTKICVFDTGFDIDRTPCADVVTRSTVNVINGITDSGTLFGTATAPYLPMEEFADSNGDIVQHWLREHGERGFFSPDNGVSIYPVIPIETRYGGGISAVFDMNENGIAVGYSSYKLSEGREEDVLDPDTGCVEPNRFNVPYEICIQDPNHQRGMYHIQAFKATVLDSGIPATEGLGLLITPHADDLRGFSSQALAVNNHGVAVGYAHGWNNTDVITPDVNERMNGSYAVIYKEDEEGNKEVFDFNQTHYYLSNGVFAFSKAHDINDNGLVVGYTTDINTYVKKLFYVDTSVPNSEMKIVMPKDFFTTSVSGATGVNNHGVIVGKAQIETHNENSDNPRRTVGFIYDTASDSPVIIDVNTLLTCDSPFNILEANDINDNGVISATAIVKSESFDALGEPILDDSGNPKIIDVVRAVILKPLTGGEVEDCGLTEDKVERQGASLSGFSLISLLVLFGLRRRKVKL